MPKIPVLKLPLLCIICILQNSEFHVLINFSFLSRKCYRLVSISRTTLTGLDLHSNKRRTRILFIRNNEVIGKWIFQDLRESIGDTVTVSGFRMNICIEETDVCTDTQGNFKLCVSNAITYLKQLFKTPFRNITLDLDDTPCGQLFRGPETCENLKVEGFEPADDYYLYCILNNIHASKFLKLSVVPDCDFRYNIGKITTAFTEVMFCHWISKKMLLKMKHEKLLLTFTQFSSADCIEFIQAWLLSSNNTFQALHMGSNIDKFRNINYDGMGGFPWNQELRSRYYRFSPFLTVDCARGVDFLRRDGVLATAVVYKSRFNFVVWTNRFHSVEGITDLI